MVNILRHTIYLLSFLIVILNSGQMRFPCKVRAEETTDLHTQIATSLPGPKGRETLNGHVSLSQEGIKRYMGCKEISSCDQIMNNVIKLRRKLGASNNKRARRASMIKEKPTSNFLKISVNPNEIILSKSDKRNSVPYEDTNTRSVFKWG